MRTAVESKAIGRYSTLMKRIPELDGMRALAVSVVILDHFAPFRSVLWNAPARFGGLGVDIFFVLSGFLITSILLHAKSDPHPYRVFYARRSLRILPAFFLLLIFVYSAAALLRESFSWRIFVAQLFFLRSFRGTGNLLYHAAVALRHPLDVPNLLVYRGPVAFSRDYPRLPMSASLGPTWSLSVEEWFYLLWAPVALLLTRKQVLVTSLAICGLGFLLRWVSLGSTSFFTCCDILVVGALLALWIEYRAVLPSRQVALMDKFIVLASVGAFALWVLLTYIHRDLLSISLIEIILFGSFCWILRHSGDKSILALLLRARPLAYVGGISYMIYLIHLPMYFLVRHASDHFCSRLTTAERLWFTAIASASATLLFAAASRLLFEEPILRQKDRMTHLLNRDSTRIAVPRHSPAVLEPAESNLSK
jgi:peptidoglycan/LPS O-acetylase OafA/YrhL